MSFNPAKPKFIISTEATWHYRFIWQEQTGTLEKPILKPKNVSGFTGTLKIVPDGTTTPWMTYSQVLTPSGSGIVFNGESGLIDLIISEADTSTISWKTARFILKVKDPASGESDELMDGRFATKAPL